MTHSESWSSRFIFLLASIGAAVGLANIWKFPYTAGEHGGGGFVLIYLVAIALISFPILTVEFMLGRRGQSDPVGAIVKVAKEAKRSPLWSLAAYAGIVASVLTMSFYFVITGWIIYYALQIALGNLSGLSSDEIGGFFQQLTESEHVSAIFHSLSIFITFVVVAAGLKNGVEKCVRYLMPLLFVLMLAFCIYALVYGDIQAATGFLFQVKPGDITSKTLLYAAGQAFFTVGAGGCVMIVYGSYLSRSVSIMKSSMQIVLADTMIALMAGMAIFPLVFAHQLEPAEGPGLLFVTLPIIFSQSAAGSVLGAIFFFMVAIAALTSAIAIVQAPIVWLERQLSVNRITTSAIVTCIIWLLGFGTICSFDSCASFYPLSFVPGFQNLTTFAVMEMLAINICLPLGSLLLAIFVGWRLPVDILKQELAENSPRVFAYWFFCIRYVVPPAILMILLFGLFSE